MEADHIIDLFSGVGGFSLGAHNAGFPSVVSVELDKDLSASYSENFPSSTLLQSDISQLNPFEVLRTIGKRPQEIAGIVGGPPCQGFSVMGKRNISDPRNRLVTHFFRFVRALRQIFFVMENVPGILSQPYKEWLSRELGSLVELYSVIGPITIDSAALGAATYRKRVLVIGCDSSRMNAMSSSELSAIQCQPATVRDAIEDLASPPALFSRDAKEVYARYGIADSHSLSAYAQTARKEPPANLSSPAVRERLRRGEISGFQPTLHTHEVRLRFSHLHPGEIDNISRYPRLQWDCPCPTLRAGTGKERGSYQAGRPIHPEEDRVVTVREAARLQGFPDWFQFHPAKWHSFRMIGNSVSPYLSTAVLRVLFSHMI